MNEIRVIVKEPGKSPEIRWVDNTLEALQKIVGGLIETVTLATDLVTICNEEGRIMDLPDNCTLYGFNFVGPIIIAGVDGCEFADVPDGAMRLLFGEV